MRTNADRNTDIYAQRLTAMHSKADRHTDKHTKADRQTYIYAHRQRRQTEQE